jgi:hypothetical protein
VIIALPLWLMTSDSAEENIPNQDQAEPKVEEVAQDQLVVEDTARVGRHVYATATESLGSKDIGG